MPDPDEKLARVLRVSSAKLEFLAALSEADRERLARDIDRARDSHGEQIRASMDEALNHVPWILRVPMKKLLGL